MGEVGVGYSAELAAIDLSLHAAPALFHRGANRTRAERQPLRDPPSEVDIAIPLSLPQAVDLSHPASGREREPAVIDPGTSAVAIASKSGDAIPELGPLILREQLEGPQRTGSPGEHPVQVELVLPPPYQARDLRGRSGGPERGVGDAEIEGIDSTREPASRGAKATADRK